MNDLQLALLLIGIFIVGVVGLSAYDRARIRGRMHSMEDEAEGMPLPGDTPLVEVPPPAPIGPVRPESRVLTSNAAAVLPAGEPERQDFYRQIREIEDAAVMPLPRVGTPGRPVPATPDEKIDFIINLPGTQPVSRDQALSIYRQSEYLLEKRRNLYGLRAGQKVWTNLERDEADTRYSHLALALQLTDSKGPVSESELNTFAQLGLKLADSLARPTKLVMTFEEALVRAESLRVFCETYDVIAGVNLLPQSRNGFSGRAVESGALRFGLEFGARNIFHCKNLHPLGSPHLFSMANLYEPGSFDLAKMESTQVQGLSLFLQVPCVHQPVRAFEKMADVGQHLCQVLGGVMVDQDRRPLSSQGIAVIRAQIERIAEAMQSEDIAPGSSAALRLFELA